MAKVVKCWQRVIHTTGNQLKTNVKRSKDTCIQPYEGSPKRQRIAIEQRHHENWSDAPGIEQRWSDLWWGTVLFFNHGHTINDWALGLANRWTPPGNQLFHLKWSSCNDTRLYGRRTNRNDVREVQRQCDLSGRAKHGIEVYAVAFSRTAKPSHVVKT